MSMNATFVQVDDAQLARFKADPGSVEALFQGEGAMPEAFIRLSQVVQDRVRAVGPQMLAESLAKLDPALRQRLTERLGKTPAEWAHALGGDEILQMMERGRSRRSAQRSSPPDAILSLDKAWHGVHYLLCGEAEPGTTILSQAVLGGSVLGEDDEGFSGYGPPRCFDAAQVAEIAEALNRPELESEAAGRFDAERMAELGIYPGWQPTDSDWVLDGLRRLRGFYADAAAKQRAVVTGLV